MPLFRVLFLFFLFKEWDPWWSLHCLLLWSGLRFSTSRIITPVERHTHTHTAMRKRAVRVKEIIAVIILLSRSVPSQAKPRTSRRGPVDKLLHLCQKVLLPWPWREARPVLVLTWKCNKLFHTELINTRGLNKSTDSLYTWLGRSFHDPNNKVSCHHHGWLYYSLPLADNCVMYLNRGSSSVAVFFSK